MNTKYGYLSSHFMFLISIMFSIHRAQSLGSNLQNSKSQYVLLLALGLRAKSFWGDRTNISQVSMIQLATLPDSIF